MSTLRSARRSGQLVNDLSFHVERETYGDAELLQASLS